MKSVRSRGRDRADDAGWYELFKRGSVLGFEVPKRLQCIRNE
jgi:hypothetical protein